MARKQHGGGTVSFIAAVLLIGFCVYVGYVIFPAYYNAKEFESALVNEGVRAGVRSYSDELIIKEITQLGRGFGLNLKADNIRVRRMGEKVELTVEYDVPLEFNLLSYTYTWHFVAQTTSHLGII